MKSHRQVLWFNVPGGRPSLNITPQLEAALAGSGAGEGLCHINAMQIYCTSTLTPKSSQC